MLLTDIVALARTAERLRFRIRHHLGGDAGRLEGLMADLNQLNPWHPIALNDRAERALPETFAPAPSPDIAVAARLFQKGDIEGALGSATAVAAHDAPSLLVQADLQVLQGQDPSAVLDAAIEALGPLPVVRLRLSRMHLAAGRPKQAFQEAAHALAANPVYGSAREAHGLACAGLSKTRVSIPVRSPVRFLAGHAHYPDTLSPRARAAWRAWTSARDSQDVHTTPPGGPAHRALLDAWRAQPDEPAFYREDPNTELKVLDRWDREGVLEAYEWSSGLSFRNADAFRKYKEGADNGALLKFWKSGVLQLPVQA
jgi:hypothetical protein